MIRGGTRMAYYPSNSASISSNPEDGIGTASTPSPGFGFATAPTSVPPNLYSGTADGDILSIDPDTLTLNQSANISSYRIIGIAWDGQLLYAFDSAYTIYTLDPSTLNVLYKISLNPSEATVYGKTNLFTWYSNGYLYTSTQTGE